MRYMYWSLPAVLALGVIAAPFIYAPGASTRGVPALGDGLHFTQTVTRTVDVPLDRFRAWLGTADLGEMLPGSAMMPSVKETRAVSGVWGQPGAVRRVFLSDGSTVLERFIVERPPHYSTYMFTPESGPARRLVNYVRGEFLFTSLPDGRTHVEWRYSVKPRSGWATLHALVYSLAVGGFVETAITAMKGGAEAAENPK